MYLGCFSSDILSVDGLPIPPINEPNLDSSLLPLGSIVVYSLSFWLFPGFLFGILSDPDSKSTEDGSNKLPHD